MKERAKATNPSPEKLVATEWPPSSTWPSLDLVSAAVFRIHDLGEVVFFSKAIESGLTVAEHHPFSPITRWNALAYLTIMQSWFGNLN